MSARPSTRYARIDIDAVLDAALAIAAEGGAGRVTLDAVAARAGVSKGGLLYRFATKDALYGAMIDRLNAHFDAGMAAARAAGAQTALAAYCEAALMDDPAHDAALASLLAVAADSPHLIDRFRAPQAVRFGAILADGARLEDAALVVLAVDGLWLSQLIGFAPFTPQQTQAIRAALRARARGDTAKPSP
jgi:AcrR family transcriptional regulator